MKYKMA